jgi:peroxiredoxin
MIRVLIYGMLTLSFLTACGSPNKSKEKKIVTKENLLDGLHPPVAYSIPSNLLSITPPVYTEDAVEISREEMRKMTESGEYSSLPYVNDKNEVQLWLVKKMTDQEKEQMKDAVNKRMNIPDLKGKPAAPFSVTDIHGKKFDLKELKGKIVVMNFWFIGCKPCVQEMDDLNELVDKCKNKDVIFLSFATDPKDKLTDFLKKKPLRYNVVADANEVCNQYGVKVFPANLVVDQNSVISYFSTGFVETASTDMLAEIERLEKL